MSKFAQILSRSNVQIREDRARRFNKRGYQAMKSKIMQMDQEKDALEEAIDASLDISTSNDRNSINAIEAFDAVSWVNRIVDNKVKLKILNEKLQVANAVFMEYFEDEIAEYEGMAVAAEAEDREDAEGE